MLAGPPCPIDAVPGAAATHGPQVCAVVLQGKRDSAEQFGASEQFPEFNKYPAIFKNLIISDGVAVSDGLMLAMMFAAVELDARGHTDTGVTTEVFASRES